MDMPDNISCKRTFQPEMLKKTVILGLCSGLAFIGISCGKAETATYDRGPARPAAEAISEADRFYSDRPDLGKVRQAIVSLRQAQGEDQSNYDIAWRLAKYNYYLGAHSDNSSEQTKAFADGLVAGTLAVTLQDGKPEGHFWLGANYGGRAKNSTMAGLSGVEDIKSEMEKVLKIDERFQSASAYMVLGQVYCQSPRMMGGDVPKAIEYLEKGARLAPDNALMRVRLAEAYAAANRKGEAKKAIDDLLVMKPVPGYEPEYNEAVAEAKKLQEKIS
jgi:tetratricopeptide (TPR) repeat protein